MPEAIMPKIKIENLQTTTWVGKHDTPFIHDDLNDVYKQAIQKRVEEVKSPFNKGDSEQSPYVRSGTNGTMIVLIVDESSSMYPYISDTIGGIKGFIDDQKNTQKNSTLTVYKFGGNRINAVIANVAMQNVDVEQINYAPLGSTNLLDAIGVAINHINIHLKLLSEQQRPNVIVNIITDGEENISTTFNKSTIKQMIDHCKQSDWGFIFMGANIDAFAESTSLGFTVHNTLQYTTSKTQDTYRAASAMTTRLAAMGTKHYDVAGFTDVERARAVD
jgi:hypothetical protein